MRLRRHTRLASVLRALLSLVLACAVVGGCDERQAPSSPDEDRPERGVTERIELGSGSAEDDESNTAGGFAAAAPADEARDDGCAHPEDDFPTAKSPSVGPSDAPVTMVVFCSLSTVACAVFHDDFHERLQQEMGDDLRIVYKHFPRPEREEDARAARAAMVAHSFGRFWPYLERIVRALEDPAQADDFLSDEALARYARGVGIDGFEFERRVTAPGADQPVAHDLDLGRELGVRSVPAVFLNGERYDVETSTAVEYEALANAIREVAEGCR